MIQKRFKSSLKANYVLFFQIGLIMSLSFFLALTKIHFNVDDTIQSVDEFEPEVLIVLPPVIPPETPPAPLKPFMPVEVPDNSPIEIELDIPDLDITGFEYAIPEPPESEKSNEIHDLWGIEVAPEMIGGIKELYKEVVYPEMAKKAGIEGLVTVQFIVNKKGEVEQPQILRGIGGGCDEEVLRVIRLMKFTPGVQNGNFINVRMAQSVRFELQN